MKSLTSIAELKSAILELEAEQRTKGHELKEHFTLAYKSISPIELIKEAFTGGDSKPGILENALMNGVGLAAGYVTRRVVAGPSPGAIRSIVSTILQFGATTVVAQNAGTLRSVGQLLMKMFKPMGNKEKVNQEKFQG